MTKDLRKNCKPGYMLIDDVGLLYEIIDVFPNSVAVVEYPNESDMACEVMSFDAMEHEGWRMACMFDLMPASHIILRARQMGWNHGLDRLHKSFADMILNRKCKTCDGSGLGGKSSMTPEVCEECHGKG